MTRFALAALLLLAACSPEAPAGPANVAANAAAPPAPAPAPRPKAYSEEESGDLVNWSLAYPAAVAAIPALADQIEAASLKQKAANIAEARADKVQRAETGAPFNAYEQADSWTVAGETDRLLSLANEWSTFTGGAHPNHGTRGLLWDKVRGEAIALDVLLPGGLNRLGVLYRNAYCKALDAARGKKRQGEDAVKDPTDPFQQCPKLEELAIIPKGPKGGGPMTALWFHADPYVAGPYVEGDYEIELPVSAEFIAALRPDYRASFAAAAATDQRQ